MGRAVFQLVSVEPGVGLGIIERRRRKSDLVDQVGNHQLTAVVTSLVVVRKGHFHGVVSQIQTYIDIRSHAPLLFLQ